MTDRWRPARIDIPDHAPHVLVVDDDRRLRDLLARFLAEHGYRVTTAASAAEARGKIGELRVRRPRPRRDDAGRDRLRLCPRRAADLLAGPDPDADGPRRHRRPGHRPRDRRRRLPAETLRAARADPAARQHPQARAAPRRGAGEPRALEVDPLRPVLLPLRPRRTAARATRSCASPSASARSSSILGLRAGGNVAREELAGQGAAANERTVDVQINRLRRKIEADPANPVYLQTVRGIGYRLDRSTDEASARLAFRTLAAGFDRIGMRWFGASCRRGSMRARSSSSSRRWCCCNR